MPSRLLSLTGALLAVSGGVILYTQAAVVDRDSFADRAVDALHDKEVRRVVSREVAAQLVGSVGLDIGATPPEVRATVDRAIRTPTFERAFRRAASDTTFEGPGTGRAGDTTRTTYRRFICPPSLGIRRAKRAGLPAPGLPVGVDEKGVDRLAVGLRL